MDLTEYLSKEASANLGKDFTGKYYLAMGFDDDESLSRKHITVVYFAEQSKEAVKDIARIVDEYIKENGFKSFEIDFDKIEMFGPNKDIKVVRPGTPESSSDLYLPRLKKALYKHNGSAYKDQPYKPHVTTDNDKEGGRVNRLVLASGDKIIKTWKPTEEKTAAQKTMTSHAPQGLHYGGATSQDTNENAAPWDLNQGNTTMKEGFKKRANFCMADSMDIMPSIVRGNPNLKKIVDKILNKRRGTSQYSETVKAIKMLIQSAKTHGTSHPNTKFLISSLTGGQKSNKTRLYDIMGSSNGALLKNATLRNLNQGGGCKNSALSEQIFDKQANRLMRELAKKKFGKTPRALSKGMYATADSKSWRGNISLSPKQVESLKNKLNIKDSDFEMVTTGTTTTLKAVGKNKANAQEFLKKVMEPLKKQRQASMPKSTVGKEYKSLSKKMKDTFKPKAHQATPGLAVRLRNYKKRKAKMKPEVPRTVEGLLDF